MGTDKKVDVEITSEGPAAIVVFKTASISDVEGITAASKQIRGFVEENHPNKVIFDFERVKFFSSQVLGVLLDVRARLTTYDGEVVISAMNPQLHKIFEITNLDRIFSFFPDKGSAVNPVSTEGAN